MINWDEFEHIHVIRKLKEVIAKWWNIDVFFADDRGNLKIVEKEISKATSSPQDRFKELMTISFNFFD